MDIHKMTDKEMIELIAVKIMGWIMPKEKLKHTKNVYVYQSEHSEFLTCFNPLENEKSCMMAWDKFSEEFLITHLGMNDGEWTAAYCDLDEIWEEAGNQDRRRAMVTCMAKAVS